MWAEHNSRENLTERGEFGIHTTYVCGTLQIDAAKNKINMAYSTENLLLNEYRQGQHGMPSIVHVDCTHRVVVDGHVCRERACVYWKPKGAAAKRASPCQPTATEPVDVLGPMLIGGL